MLATRERLAPRLADPSAQIRAGVLEVLGLYILYLHAFRFREDQLVPEVRSRWPLGPALRLTLYVGVLGVVMLAGILINLAPPIVVASAGRPPAAP